MSHRSRRPTRARLHCVVPRLVFIGVLLVGLAGCSNDDDMPVSSGGDTQAPGAGMPGEGTPGTGSPGGTAGDAIVIRTMSNRADLVSGNDALVEILLPAADAAGLQVDVDGRDVTAAFAAADPGNRVTRIGLVENLTVGANVITASNAAGKASTLTITNAPASGPVISGAQITPYYCATPTPQIASGNTPATNASGLSAAATDGSCSVSAEYRLYYKSTAANCSFALPDPSPAVNPVATEPPAAVIPPENPCFKPFDANAAVPDDLDTVPGTAVPFVVRVERGTMNRGIYDIAALFDPTQPWTATAPQAQWSGKVLYQFGASTGQPRRQSRPAGSWANYPALAQGYMVVSNSMSDSARNSNRVMMAETVMMMKEHITDRYGPIKFTIGSGCSGGSINANGNASIAPGQLDGIVIFCTYPDSETTGIEVGDCTLLSEAYQKDAWLALEQVGGLTRAQINARKAAINGHPDQTGCHGWMNAFGSNAKAGNYRQRVVADPVTGAIVTQPDEQNNCELPAGAVYDSNSNANGARCNAASWAASIWGKVDGTVLAKATADNEGVQYGLKALRDGAITAEEFVTLNEIIGGTNRDNDLRAERSAADADALAIAYRAGIVSSGRNLAQLPIIDMRGWDDSGLQTPPGRTAPPSFPIHFVWRSFSLRERLDREFGDHDNHVMWRFGRDGLVPSVTMQLEALAVMDAWLTEVVKLSAADPAGKLSGVSLAQAVRQARPLDKAFDFCLLSDDESQANRVTDMAVCNADPFLKPSSSPRQVAGGPLAENVLKCQREPLDVAGYGPVTFSGEQLARLQVVFVDGVCDWSKPGVGQTDAVSPLTFAGGAGGASLPAAPVSQAASSTP